MAPRWSDSVGNQAEKLFAWSQLLVGVSETSVLHIPDLRLPGFPT